MKNHAIRFYISVTVSIPVIGTFYCLIVDILYRSALVAVI